MKGEGEIEVEIMAQRRKNKWDMKYMPPHTHKKKTPKWDLSWPLLLYNKYFLI